MLSRTATLFALTWLAAGPGTSPHAAAQRPDGTDAPVHQPGYTLVWHDEFTRTGSPDPARWRYETGYIRNHELQYYTPDNAAVRDGMLVISANRERPPEPGEQHTLTPETRRHTQPRFTSASLEMRREHAFQYGRVIVRAAIKTEPGLWPAIWTVGVDRRWPACGETHIMAFYDQTILANFCWADPNGQPAWHSAKKSMAWLYQQAAEQAWDERFHVWQLDWTADHMTIQLDGVTLNTFDVERATDPNGFNPFRQPHVLKLNLAIGSNGGDPTNTPFPSRYLIDYVRVYRRHDATNR